MAFQSLFAKLRPDLDALLGEPHVVAGAAGRDQRVAQRVGAVLLDDLERIDARAERLAHALAVLVAHGAVQVDGGVRDLAEL